jgi:lipoprotein-anchoring transpeptidase ErfK/SrfK
LLPDYVDVYEGSFKRGRPWREFPGTEQPDAALAEYGKGAEIVVRVSIVPLLTAGLLAACSPQGGSAPSSAAPPPASATKPAAKPAAAASPLQARVDAINNAQFTAPPPQPAAPPVLNPPPDPSLIKAEVLLARAEASPGSIDGLAGSNLKRAVKAYQQMSSQPTDGVLSAALWARLTAQASGPVAAIYTVTAQDVAGPFYPDVGENMVAAAKLASPGYARPSEMLAERFHMSEKLLLALNPGADLTKSGTALVVVQPAIPALAPVDHLEVDKAAASVRAYAADGTLVASFPATVGSTDRPSPSGVHKVRGVAFNPTYTYDPAKLTFGPRKHGKFIIQPGPNNPVGIVYIALDRPGYGLHGTPEPDKIGKTASHGCVRLTNWDALLLSHAVKPGVVVSFVHARGGKAA